MLRTQKSHMIIYNVSNPSLNITLHHVPNAGLPAPLSSRFFNMGFVTCRVGAICLEACRHPWAPKVKMPLFFYLDTLLNVAVVTH